MVRKKIEILSHEEWDDGTFPECLFVIVDARDNASELDAIFDDILKMDRINDVRALQVCVEGYPRLEHLPIDKMPGLKSLSLDGFSFPGDPGCFAMFSDLNEVLFVNCAGIQDLGGFRGSGCRATTV